MIVRYKSLFRFRYLFGLIFAVLAILFIQNFIVYIQVPNNYLGAFLPGLHPHYLLHKLSGVEFLIIDFTLLSFLLVIAFIGLSFWFDRKTDRQKKQRIKTENDVIPIIIEYVYQDLLFISKTQNSEGELLKEKFKDATTLNAILVTIVHFQDLIDEDLSGRLYNFCKEIGAMKRIEYFLRSVKDGDAILGLRVVKTIKAKEFLPFVNHYIHSGNPILRIEAIMSKLSFTEETDPNELFSSHQNLSSMDINKMLPEFKKHIQTLDNLNRFLESSNTRINAIGVILLKEKKDESSKKLIQKLLVKNDPFLKKVVWDYLTDFAKDSDTWFFSVLYWKECPSNKSKILTAMGRMKPSDIWTNFLDKVIRLEDAPFKVLALDAFFKQDIEYFLRYMDESDTRIELAYNEVINLVN